MAAPSGINPETFDPNIRVQDDLFEHVNGKWLETHEIPADRSIDGSMRDLVDKAETQVKAIIEEAAASAAQDAAGAQADGEPQSINAKIGELYASFMDEKHINELGVAPIAGELASISECDTKAEFARALGVLGRTHGASAFGVFINNDAKDPDLNRTYFMQGGLGLPDEAYYREDQHGETREKYVQHIAEMLKLSGIASDFGVGTAEHVTNKDYQRAAEQVMALETKLAQYHWDQVKDREETLVYNPMSFDQLAQLAPEFNWDGWVQALGVDKGLLSTVIVREPSFFEGFGKVWAEFPLETWKLWAAYHLITARANYLTDKVAETSFDFYGRTLSGTPEMRERWKRGVSLVEGALGEAVGEIYVAKHFPPENKAGMDELVRNLIEAYRQSISSLDWMGEVTKAKALDKLEKTNPKIGYPNKWRDYRKLEIVPGDLVGNIRRIGEFETDREIGKLSKPVDREEWYLPPQTVNAYYNPGLNEIVFPAAILQPPFYDLNVDDAVNYGGIGAVIGHEIGHGFDDQGSRYDGDGRLEDWWTEADRAAFEERTKALIKQYDAYVPKQLLPDGPNLSGSFTIGENIGDLGGLTIALKAYGISLAHEAGIAHPTAEQATQALEDAPVIDGFTGVQRLFLGWGQVWQSKSRDELMALRIHTDPHSPAEFRCNGVVRNLPAFYDAFDVTPDDGLYLPPEERVKIW